LRTADQFRSVLEHRDRTKAGPTAPAHGLYLIEVKY
jgi:tRNA pseudouridine38-40 synthase